MNFVSLEYGIEYTYLQIRTDRQTDGQTFEYYILWEKFSDHIIQ